jgi:hypothetical protein
MISHHQEPAMYMARTLKELLERQLVAEAQPLTEVWLDRLQAANREGMYEGVRRSRSLVALLTKDYFTRDWCIQEIRWALHHRKNIVLVYLTDPRRDGVAGSFSEYYRPQIKRAFPDEVDFNWIMLNTYIEFTPDGGHDTLMLRNPQTQRGILDQMRFPVPARTAPLQATPQQCDTRELVRVCIYSSGSIAVFDEARLKRVLSAKLGEKIRESNIRIQRIRGDPGPAPCLTAPLSKVFAFLGLSQASGHRGCTVRVEIDEDAYLSSVSTDSESDGSSQDDEVELDDTRQDVRTRVLRLFHGQVTEDSISVEWIREDKSYFVLVQMTAVAAAILCHLVELGDPVVHELDIAAVVYGSKCVGMDYATMHPKITTEPMHTLLTQALIPVKEIRAVWKPDCRQAVLATMVVVGCAGLFALLAFTFVAVAGDLRVLHWSAAAGLPARACRRRLHGNST